MTQPVDYQLAQIVLATPAPLSNRTAEENLGLGYLAAVLRKRGYSVTILDGWLAGMNSYQIAEKILSIKSILFLAFSCYRSNMEKAVEVVKILRRSGLISPIVTGGFGPTFHPEEFLKAGFDIVSRGEGEETLLELCAYFLHGYPKLSQILGISFKNNGKFVHNQARPLIRDLDTLPFPERDTMPLAIKRKSPIHILTARGCQAHCIFCSIVAFQKLSEGPQWRQRSINNFVDELEYLVSKGAKYFKVVDDSLIEPPRDAQWCTNLADEIQRRGLNIQLRGSIRADRVNDDIIRELKRAGFFAFSCGIENGSQTALKRMGKSATIQQNIQALKLFKKHKIYVQAGHILFEYRTTLAELQENYEFMSRYIWIISKGVFSEMYAAPGTVFTNLLNKKNLIKQNELSLGNAKYPVLNKDARQVYYALKIWHKSHMHVYDMTIDPISAPKALDLHELNLFHLLYVELRKRDLNFMKLILDLVNHGADEKQLSDFTMNEIKNQNSWYTKFEEKVWDIYHLLDLTYDAEDNPFIC